jgi:predicted O-methyltransferase YrrM
MKNVFWNNLKKVRHQLDVVLSMDSVDELDNSYKLPRKLFPYSITDEEGIIMSNVIIANELNSGYEIATAFGYSTLYCGLALNENNGRLMTVDCYVEEWKESFNYNANELVEAVSQVRSNIEAGIHPTGLDFLNHNIRRFNLADRILPFVAVSPDEIKDVVNSEMFDFAFIDGGHFGEQPTKDVQAIEHLFKEKVAVFFHDNNNNSYVENAIKYTCDILNSNPIIFPTRYNLTMVARGISYTSYSEILALSQKRAEKRVIRPMEIPFLDRLRYFIQKALKKSIGR